MKRNGFQFLVDEKGDKSAVLIDLKKHRRLWEDFYDLMIFESRRGESRVEWEGARKRLFRNKE